MKPKDPRGREKGRRKKSSNMEEIDLDNFCVAAVCEGWKVLKQREQLWSTKKKSSIAKPCACFLWNSEYASEKIDLPEIPAGYKYVKCVLSAPPESAPQCLVFLLIENIPRLFFCRVGDKNWTLWRYDYDQEEEIDLCDAIMCNRKLYVLNTMGDLCELIVGSHQLQLKRYNASFTLDSVLSKEQLVESCGELFIVQRRSLFDIAVFKMDFNLDKWERVLNLDPGMNFVLIGHYSASISTADLGIGGDCDKIYFTENDDDETLYSFNLANTSLSVLRNHPHSGSVWVFHDQMLSQLRLPDIEARGYNKQIFKQEHIDEVDQNIGVVQESRYQDEDDEGHENIWFKLGCDMQKSIVQRLSTVFDYMNFRVVCKSWRSLALPIQWKPNHVGVPFKYPWLMFSDDDQGETIRYKFYDPISNLMHCISLPELQGCKIRFSTQGWLLVTKLASSSIFFFEPFSRKRIQLPSFREDYWLDGICFSDSPTSPNWQIFGIAYLDQREVRVMYLRAGWEDWVSSEISSEKLPDCCYSNPIFDGQRFSYLGSEGNIIFLKHTEPNVIEYCPKALLSHSSSTSSRRFLACYGNELISVFLDQMGKSIQLFKLDRERNRWLEIKSLDDKVLYLSHTTSLCLEETLDHQTIIRNSIQFSMFSDMYKNGSNISFSLKKRSYQIYNGAGSAYSSFTDLYDTKEFLQGTWIQPLVVPVMATDV